jgi:hypothetical protein
MLDVCAFVVLLVMLFMPPRGMGAIGAYEHRAKGDKARDVEHELAVAGQLQAQLLANPGDGALAEEFAAQMSDLGRHDMSLRIAGAAAAIPGPSNWRSLSAVSAAHADRIEIHESLSWAEKAMKACEEPGAACPDHEKLRLRLYIDQLQLGVDALARGADPKFDPDGFRRELSKRHPTTRTGVKNDK